VDFLFMPKDYSMGPFFATIDTAVLGRKTYDDALKMGGGGFSGSKMKNYVFSHSQPPGERGGVTFVNESPKTFVENLRKRPGKNPNASKLKWDNGATLGAIMSKRLKPVHP